MYLCSLSCLFLSFFSLREKKKKTKEKKVKNRKEKSLAAKMARANKRRTKLLTYRTLSTMVRAAVFETVDIGSIPVEC